MKTFDLNFVAVGPQRTGSTWLYQLLAHHPAICFPKDVKETMFFDRYYEKGLSWYTAHFTHRSEEQLCGEIAPTYFDVDVVPTRLHQLNPECRIMINLRNPVFRTLSLYRHHLSKGRISGSFEEAISQMPRIIDSGKYAQHIPRWLDKFGIEQVKFLLLDEIESTPETVLKSVSNFLGVAEIALPLEKNQRVNAATMPRFPLLAKAAAQLATGLRANRLHKVVEFGKSLGLKQVYTGGEQQMPGFTASDRFWLKSQYEEDIVFVEKLLGRDLSAWRQTE